MLSIVWLSFGSSKVKTKFLPLFVQFRRKKKEEKERREEGNVSRKLRLGNYRNFSPLFCCFELGLKLVLIVIWLWSSIEEF